MMLLYSSHGDAAEVYGLCAKKPTEPSDLERIGKTITDGASDPNSLSASVLDRREIRSLAQRSDPRFFLFLRELSIHIKKAYEPQIAGLTELGFSPAKNVLVRLCDGTSSLELLAVGVLSALCGVKGLTISLDRATMTPDIASACRLCGIETVILCDEVSSAGIAAYGARGLAPFSRFVCVGSEALGAACGITGGAVESRYYPEQKITIFAQFGKECTEAFASDIACCDNRHTPIIITSSEAEALVIDEKFRNRDGVVLLTSSDEETRVVLEKCKNTQKRLYGAIPDDVFGIRASKASPLMLAACSPDSVYPYKPADFLCAPERGLECGVTAFASSIASFVERSIISDEELEAIGIRLQNE